MFFFSLSSFSNLNSKITKATQDWICLCCKLQVPQALHLLSRGLKWNGVKGPGWEGRGCSGGTWQETWCNPLVLSTLFCFVTWIEIRLNICSARYLRVRTWQNYSRAGKQTVREAARQMLSVSASQSDSIKGCFTKHLLFHACVSVPNLWTCCFRAF